MKNCTHLLRQSFGSYLLTLILYRLISGSCMALVDSTKAYCVALKELSLVVLSDSWFHDAAGKHTIQVPMRGRAASATP